MMRDINRHADVDELEQYSMGTLPEEEREPLEEHLLACPNCQQRMREADEYVSAMRMAGVQARLDEMEPARRVWRIPTWFPALAVVACSLLLMLAAVRFVRQPGPIATVTLTAMRGNGSSSVAPAGRDLVLHPDLTGLVESTGYRLEIVDQSGHPVRQANLVRSAGQVRVAGFGRGQYFVRVLLPQGELLREYGLVVQ